MTSHSTQFAPLSRIGIYELPLHQLSMWDDPTFESSLCSPGTGVCATIIDTEHKIDDKSDQYASDKSLGHSEDNQASNGISEKIQRRLAQNREAAKKSRLRKKAYVQQLEKSRLKLAQLELEVGRARQQVSSSQGLLIAGAATNMPFCGTVNSGIDAFEMEYGRWIDEQDRKISELRNLLQTPIADVELQILVENVLNHYCNLFRMKRAAARADAFYLVSGMWRTSVERFFLWIGGFRPSELVNVVFPHLEPLDDLQRVNVTNLRDSCSQAEEALTQGMDKLRQTLSQSITFPAVAPGSYSNYQMGSALEKLESLETFIHQADHLREQSLQQMSLLLTTRQAAKGLVAFAEHFQRLRALSSLWSARPQRSV